MEGSSSGELVISTSLGRHLAFAPVAFAVTEGPAHALVYANAIFRGLLSAGDISLGPAVTKHPSAADLTPVLNRVFETSQTVRSAVVAPATIGSPTWSCSVWPIEGADDAPKKLVIEVRDEQVLEAAMQRQRAVAEQLLLGALREQDISTQALNASDRANYLARASRDLSMSLDESATRDTVRRLALPRPGAWCIVDVVESNGALHRLAVIHPDPEKEALAHTLERQWPTAVEAVIAGSSSLRAPEHPMVLTHESGAALMAAAHGEDNLRILDQIGFGALLLVPLIVRGRVQGAITFVTAKEDPPFAPEEITLAVDLAARCAMALDNARLYREADGLKLAAELANKSKSEFLGSMSHELRTPLNAIGGFTELIEIGVHGPVTKEQQVALARIKVNQEHLLKLITEILNFVRIESGRMEYKNVEVPASHALADVVGMLSGVIAEKGLTVQQPTPDAEVVAWADADRMRQILVNLVMNAVKYTPQTGGVITLSCEAVGDAVVMRVADTGQGIPQDRLESIFEPFVQLTAGLAEQRGGVGLGLAISRDLARAMGGDLTAESTVGVGSQFTLTLPRARSSLG
jgi:signal transduction histidine kinase